MIYLSCACEDARWVVGCKQSYVEMAGPIIIRCLVLLSNYFMYMCTRGLQRSVCFYDLMELYFINCLVIFTFIEYLLTETWIQCEWPGCTSVYSSRRKTDLEDHMNSHNGLKPHECSVCGKRVLDLDL